MKNTYLFALFCLLLLMLAAITACGGQSNTKTLASNNPKLEPGAQIDEYVVEIFEDKAGNLWFGTLAKGVARYDGKTLTYLSTADGLCGNSVVSMAEDDAGNLWFGTHSGLSKYSGGKFTNYTQKDGLCNDRVSNVLIDRAGTVWVGTWGGVCRFNGASFTDFPLPMPDVNVPSYQETANWVTTILEDKHGDIWIGRSGYGACKYNTASGAFTQFTKKDGLASNCVQAIVEDRQGQIWFGCRVAENDHPDAGARTGDGGLSRYDGNTFIQFPEVEGLSKNNVYTIYEDRSGDIWICATGIGAYRFNGEKFTLFKETERMDLTYSFGLQSLLEDQKGTLWCGFSGGLFRFNGTTFVNVTSTGPWK